MAALAVACTANPPTSENKVERPTDTLAPISASGPAAPVPAARGSDPALGPAIVVTGSSVVSVQADEPQYATPESMKLWRGGKPPPGPKKSPSAATAPLAKATSAPETPIAVQPRPAVATIDAMGDEPRYALPESLSHWHGTRTAPLYADPNVEQWEAAPTEARLQNAAVSCNYKDEGGVRGKIMLLVDKFKLTRFNARIEMPNGGVCTFDSKKMQQRPFEQGLALESKGDECVVRMWEQKHRITVAAYNCHRQCTKGSFSYLWPILMDTRLGTCY